MQELVKIEKHNGINVVSSRIIAEHLGKKHYNILRDLEKVLENSNMSSLIIPSFYRPETQTRQYREYLLTKDGFTLYMFNIQGYNDFKMAYINKFNEMENQIQLSLTNQNVDNNVIKVLLENQKRLEEKLDKLLGEREGVQLSLKLNNKKNNKVYTLPVEVQEMINKMLKRRKVNYSEIMRKCLKMGIEISSSTIRKYHKLQKGEI